MKLLRILTGLHAGAQLRLARQRYVLGGDAQADIVLTDWRQDPVCLTVTDSGQVIVSPPGADTPPVADEAGDNVIEDLAPRRFGDIVICVGPIDAQWPSDVRLMESLVLPPPQPPRRRKPQPADDPAPVRVRPPKSRRALIVGTGAVAVVMFGMFVSVIGPGRHNEAVAAEPLQVKVAHALQAANVSGVSVRTAPDGSVSVEGMVFDGAEASRLRNALVPFVGERLAHRYASASDVAQSIGDALANPGLSVRYRGDGEFIVTGASMDLNAVRGKLHRIATDLGQQVARITLAASELPPAQTLPTNALMSSGNMQYVQTRDGTKHLVIRKAVEEVELFEPGGADPARRPIVTPR